MVWAVNLNNRLLFAEILNVFDECGYRLWQRVDTEAVREFVSDIQRQAAAPRSEEAVGFIGMGVKCDDRSKLPRGKRILRECLERN
jgi:hypothetical protein